MDDETMMHCQEPTRQIERLRAIMHRLRAPGGCPWDAEQTHESLISNLIEEAYECVDAIRSGDKTHMREELGDLLLQVVFHSELASERGDFHLDDVAAAISDKLVHRHPHVFGDSQVQGSDAVLVQWDAIKRAEKGEQDQPYLHGVGRGLPSLLRAMKLQKKASKVGFDWPDDAGVMAKVEEEMRELTHEFENGNEEAFAEEWGDLVFSLVNLARVRGMDPEVLMAQANQKFEQRFAAMESLLRESGLSLAAATLEEMEERWQKAKRLSC
ncbi:MAG: nucleoside triphosphate pyrophosphohydrolase [Verrucomicrobiota bacterium]|jgi:MazG family protein